MNDWPVQKPLGRCYGTEKTIEPGRRYFAALVETDNGLERRDYSIDYWQKEKPDVFCYWKTRLPLPDEKKKLFVDDEMLMTFFNRLENETDREKINFRFVLALILMRKRRLKYDSSKNVDEKEIWRLRVVSENDYVEVVNPHLGEEQIEQLSNQIGQILQVDL